MTPVFAYLLLIDFWLHKQYRFWWYALGFGMALLLLYFLITHALTGDFTTRFKALYSNSYLNRCSYDQQELPILLKRIGRDLILLFHREVMLASSLFVLAGLWQQKIRNVIRMDAETSFWLGLGVLVLLASNFMSISLTAYNPMCLDARHYLFIVPIMAIPGAQALEEMLFERKHRMGFWIMSLLCLAVYFLEYHRYLFTVYLPLIVSTGIAIYLPSQRLKQIFPFILILCLSLPIVNQIQYAQDVQYRKQREVVQAEILTKLKSAYVLGDKVQVNLANYYQGFKTNSELEFFSYDEGPENTSADKPIYILSNRHTQNLLFYEKQDLPFYVQYRSQGDSLCFSDESLGLELWKIDQIIDPSDDLESVFESSMGFESPQPHWNSDPNDWNQEIKRSGKASTLIREFGATLVLELDSLFEPNNSYYLEVSGYAYTADETDASLVVSFENAEGSWKYESTKVNRYLSSYSAWWQIQLNSLIQLNEVPPKSVLKIYLHNPSLHSLYLDDLEVKLGKLP